ncbi:MAG: COPII coat Sec23p-Sfb3p heterodimer component [Trizodia sp. TS-e1964]|nr:MAG: COPII coat Sec23p-Sfb3p heterodimer component [Trizodia sp. TS-e1964]
MSEYQMYHALGDQDQSQDPRYAQRRNLPAAPQFQSPIAGPPGGYQQGGGGAFQPSPTAPQQYQNTPSEIPNLAYGHPTQQGGYFPSHGGASQGVLPMIGGLVSQVGALGIGGDSAGAPSRATKKKSRHAYHDLGGPAASIPPGPGGVQGGQYQNSFQPQQQQQQYQQPQQGQYANQQITPAMSQFPAASPNGPFNPLTQATSAEHAARRGQSSNHSIATMGGPPGSSQQSGIDPEQVPSIPRSRDGPAEYYLNHIYPTLENLVPPPAAVPFIAHDQGNSSPKFARLTFANIPSTSEFLASTGLPLGLILQPLAPLQEGEIPIPLLDFGEIGPPRCRRCRAYVNPFMTFRSGGNKFVCNMCTFPNDVPPEYFSPTTPSEVRVDREQRPELMRGTVDFVVPKEYWAKTPVGLRWLVLIDVSQESLNKGFCEGFCEGILAALYGDSPLNVSENAEDTGKEKRNIPPESKIGIITFDKEIHFYNLSAGLGQAQMMVMPDIEEPFVPLAEGLFVDPYESKDVITSLLAQLPGMFSHIKNPEPALLPTLNAALAALTSTGGKIICGLSALPTWGPGRLFMRDDGKITSPDGEKKLFTTEHASWRKTAGRMVENGIGVDLFMAAYGGSYLDIATVGHVSATTGGETFFYPNFVSERDNAKLSQEIRHTVTRDTGYQALMKVRCSNGLQVSSYLGNFVQSATGSDLEFGVIDADKAIGVMFSYDGKLDAKLDAHFQSALLYTTANGERRVRCSNIVASVNSDLKEGMKLVDQDAVVHIIAKEAVSKMTERSLKDIRGALNEKTVDVLAGYRKHISGQRPIGQLVIPENLKEFGMYMLGLLKSRALKGGHEPSDRRTHDMRMIKSMGAMELSLYLYPRIIPIHNLNEQDGYPNENGHLVMPPCIRASYSRIEEGGAYIVDNGQLCLLWLHANVSPNLLADLFGPAHTTLQSLPPTLSALPTLETHLSAQVRNMLRYLATLRGSKALTVQLARQGIDGAEVEFARLLVEDRNNEAQSYVDWLVHVHRLIQLEVGPAS